MAKKKNKKLRQNNDTNIIARQLRLVEQQTTPLHISTDPKNQATTNTTESQVTALKKKFVP